MTETVNYKDVKNIVSRHFAVRNALKQNNVILLYLDVVTEIKDRTGKVNGYWVSTDIAMRQTHLYEIQDDKDSITLDISEAAKLRDALDSALSHTIYAKPTGDPIHENPKKG